jgi:mycofactocin radical SAM maturase
LTYACNLACTHCLSSSGRRDPRELTTEEAKRLIDEIAAMQIFYVNIGGGEPMMRRDFFELIEHAVGQHIGVKFSTNGTRIDPAAAKRLASIDYLDIQVSIDGADAATSDRIRGVGSYAAALRAMDNLRAADFGRFKISVVMTRDSVEQLDEFEALAKHYGAELRLTRLRPSGRGVDVWQELHPTLEQNRRLYRWLLARPNVLTGDSFFHLSALGAPLEGLNLCGAGRGVCLIDPVGEVYACRRVEFERAVRLAARTGQSGGVRFVRFLRRVSRRLHGGEVLHRSRDVRSRSRMRLRTRRGRARRQALETASDLVARPLASDSRLDLLEVAPDRRRPLG